jgi:putative hydrolase of the HAD superfamily
MAPDDTSRADLHESASQLADSEGRWSQNSAYAFDAVYGVEQAGSHPKPAQDAFDTVFACDGLIPARSAMFGDDPRNLAIPRSLGMQTVLVGPEPHADVHHHTTDPTRFLRAITAA